MRLLRNLLLASLAVGWAAPLKAAPCPGDSAWQQLMLAHRSRYPEMQLVDMFKLLQQATLGSEHAVGDPAEATAWMDREWATLADGPAEPLVDTLGAGGRFARIHLRPYRDLGGTPDKLVAAFVATAHRIPRDTIRLACALDALMDLAHGGMVPWSVDSVQAQRDSWTQQGYPAVEHSAMFERRYRPAYRVVALSLLPQISAPPKLVLGDFVDDYGGRFTVTAADWFQRPRNHYRILAWHPVDQYVIAQNAATNPSGASRWTRIDWVILRDQGAFQWGFCFSAYDAPSRSAAEATHVVDRAHPRTGCNGYPFSRMRRPPDPN